MGKLQGIEQIMPSAIRIYTKLPRNLPVVRQRYAELPRRLVGLGCECGVRDDERGGCLVDRLGGVGLFHRVITHQVRVELALDNRLACGGFDEQVRPVVAAAADADGGDAGGGEEVGDCRADNL